MPTILKSILIHAEPERIWEILKDMEGYSAFMPDVESVTVVDRPSENETITDWETSVDGTPILWTERDTFFHDEYLIKYQLTEGDLDKFQGHWQICQHENGCDVDLLVDYDFGIPELANLIGPTLEQKVGENSLMMLEGIKKQAEASTV